MESKSDTLLADILGDNSNPPQTSEVKEPVLAPLRIRSNLFPSSTASSRRSSASQESQLAASMGSPGPVTSSTIPPAVESPYAPVQADQSIVKSEMSVLDHHEYVEYEDCDGEVDIKDNLLLQCFQLEAVMVKKECVKEMLNVSWVDDNVVMPMEDSLFLRCHQFLKDESKPDEEEEEDFEEKMCGLVKGPRRRGGRSSRRRREEVGRICLRRKQDGGFEIKKEVEEEEIPVADINHPHLVFGVDNCDFCPACQV